MILLFGSSWFYLESPENLLGKFLVVLHFINDELLVNKAIIKIMPFGGYIIWYSNICCWFLVGHKTDLSQLKAPPFSQPWFALCASWHEHVRAVFLIRDPRQLQVFFLPCTGRGFHWTSPNEASSTSLILFYLFLFYLYLGLKCITKVYDWISNHKTAE